MKEEIAGPLQMQKNRSNRTGQSSGPESVTVDSQLAPWGEGPSSLFKWSVREIHSRIFP